MNHCGQKGCCFFFNKLGAQRCNKERVILPSKRVQSLDFIYRILNSGKLQYLF